MTMSLEAGTTTWSPDTEPAPRHAYSHAASHARLWIVAIVGLAVDLLSKQWAFTTLSPEKPVSLLKGWLGFQLSLNPGALFGLGAGFAPIFVGASVLALMFVLYLFIHSSASNRSMHVALGLVLAGAIGNLYDRTLVSAYVWNDPSTNQKDIGSIVRDDGVGIVLGDFMTKRHPRFHPVSAQSMAGYSPVVRDFIKIEARISGYPVWPWIFNVADALLVFGVAILLVNFWSEHKREADD